MAAKLQVRGIAAASRRVGVDVLAPHSHPTPLRLLPGGSLMPRSLSAVVVRPFGLSAETAVAVPCHAQARRRETLAGIRDAVTTGQQTRS